MGKRHKILVVEDEPKIQALVRDILIDEYDVVLARTGEEGIEFARESSPDLIILDLVMPAMDGVLACKFLRRSAATKFIPIIMLTALKDSGDRINAFKAGADDYISKPFDPEELIARVESKINRFHSLKEVQKPSEIQCGNLKVNLLSRQVFIGSVEVYFTLIEFDILKVLLEAEGSVRSRKQLVHSVWNDKSIPVRILDSHILTIRRKLKNFNRQLETVYGCGYVIRTNSEEGGGLTQAYTLQAGVQS